MMFTFMVPDGYESSFIHIEAGMPPSANVRGDLRFDLALGQIKLGPPLGRSQFYYLFNFQCYAACSLLQSHQSRFEQGLGVTWVVDTKATILKDDKDIVPKGRSLRSGIVPDNRMSFFIK